MARSAVLVTGPLDMILLEGNTWCLLSPLPVLPLFGHNSETFSFSSQVKKPKSQTTTFLQQTISNNLPLSQLTVFLFLVLELTMCPKVNLTVFCVALLIHNLHTQGIWGNNKTMSLRSSVIQSRPEYSESPNFAENCSILTQPCKMLWNGNSQPLLTHQLQRINSNRKQGHHYPAPLTSPEKTLCSCASLKC